MFVSMFVTSIILARRETKMASSNRDYRAIIGTIASLLFINIAYALHLGVTTLFKPKEDLLVLASLSAVRVYCGMILLGS